MTDKSDDSDNSRNVTSNINVKTMDTPVDTTDNNVTDDLNINENNINIDNNSVHMNGDVVDTVINDTNNVMVDDVDDTANDNITNSDNTNSDMNNVVSDDITDNDLDYDLYSVSVIMNVYKENEKYLNEAILSYLLQENVKLELIISTLEDDPCISYIKAKFKKYQNIKFCISKKKKHPGRGHLGIYYQLNRAVKYITKYWYAYASSNDVANKSKLYDEITKCLKYDKKVCYSAFYKTDDKLTNKKILKFHDYDYNKHLSGNFVNDCALIESKLLFEMMPFRSNDYHNHSYWDLWLRIYKKYHNVFIYNPIPEFYYRSHKNALHIETREIEEKKRKNLEYRTKMINHHKNAK